ncbi:MAG: TraX family protein [Comamonadaceae bacterium]|jgi:TraX protein
MPSRQRELIKMLVLATMLADHVGRIFFPDLLALRALGRLCFPLVAALLADGMLRTSNPLAYGLRLLALAVVSQWPYQLAFDPPWGRALLEPILLLRAPALIPLLTWSPLLPEGNVAFLLALSVLAVGLLKARRWLWLSVVAVAAFLLPVEYGLYGLISIVVFYLYFTRKLSASFMVLALCLLSAVMAFLSGQTLQVIAPLALIVIFPRNGLAGLKFRLPKALFYLFYPAHLLLLGSLARGV